MPICEVKGYGISLGPIKLFPVAGPEIPVQCQGVNTQVELTRRIDSSGGIYGETAKMVNSITVDLHIYRDEVTDELSFRRLIGPQINKDPLTRRYLIWVKEQTLGFLSEACQFPDSFL